MRAGGFVIAGLLFLLDQFTKYVVTASNLHIAAGFFSVGPWLNDSISIFPGFDNRLVGSFAVIILIGLVYAYFFVKQYELENTAWALILWGGLSNLLDRMLRGGVMDIMRSNTMAWNIADLMIVAGIILIGWRFGLSFFQKSPSKMLQ